MLISSSQRAIRVPRKKLAALATFIAQAEGVRLSQVDLAVVGDSEIATVNKDWLSHRGPTDVISFDLSDGGGAGLSCQLVICGEAAVREAAARGLRPQHELMLYVVHGLLHMMGYDDLAIRPAARMHARQDELLKEFLAAKPRKTKRRRS